MQVQEGLVDPSKQPGSQATVKLKARRAPSPPDLAIVGFVEQRKDIETMAMLRKGVVLLLAACLAAIATARHVKRDQVVLSAASHPRLPQVHAEGSVLMNVTFDGIDLSKQSNHTLDSVPFLKFDRFQVMNGTSAIESGFLNKTDRDCAESSPNFVLSDPGEYISPGIFHTNGEALHAAGLSKYVDVIRLTAKPVRSDFDFALISIAAWEIDNKHARNVDEIYLGFDLEENGAYESFPVTPRDFIPGWGEKVNYIEMSGFAFDDEYVEHPLQICLDDIVFELREKGDDE